MSFESISVGKYTLTKLNFNLDDNEDQKTKIDGKFQFELSEIKDKRTLTCNSELEVEIIGNGYRLELKLLVPLKLESNRKIKNEKDLSQNEIRMLFQPLLRKTSEIVGYVTANALPLPDILSLELEEIDINFGSDE